MHTDIITAVVFAGASCFTIGFFAAALFASRRIREERTTCYWEGYGAAQRDVAKRND